MKKRLLFSLFCIFSLFTAQAETIDLLIYNATIYTCDHEFSIAEAVAVHQGKIIDIGNNTDLKNKYQAVETIDANKQFVYPGFIDAHAHFVGYGIYLNTVNMLGLKSWNEVLDNVVAYSKQHPSGWIIGRGWDQNIWTEKVFPDNTELNKLFPDRPVLLRRVDGHAAIANQKALELAGIDIYTKIDGGVIEIKNKQLSGLLLDNAVDLILEHIPYPKGEELEEILITAQRNCFEQGLTTIHDCGLHYSTVEFIQKLHEVQRLQMKLYVLLSDEPENYQWLIRHGKINTDRLKVNGFKVYADGALGSRGAYLKSDYSDQVGWKGLLLNSLEHYDSVAALIYQHQFQMCTHAIGDAGNKTILNIYAHYLKGKNDLRWRIEHAQVIAPEDFHYFGQYSIIPSVQPTHATSDMHWAIDRLGSERIKGAYAYQDLKNQNGWLPLGTDFPIEDISPLKTFYAAVYRKDKEDTPIGGFQMENALSRKEALLGITIWAAQAGFEENEKGSIEIGKDADFVILNQDIMQVKEKDILGTKVTRTLINGNTVFQQNKN